MNDLKTMKDSLRSEAKRARALLSLSTDGHSALCRNFFDNIKMDEKTVLAAYWPKDRELDTQILIDECFERGIKVALPIIAQGERILKFAQFDYNTDLMNGQYNVQHPVINDNTAFLEPDIFVVPLLAFDRKGYRLGYGGGYYDVTLEHYKLQKDIVTIGLGYAQQACLFNLPVEHHDIKMDWIITEQNAQCFV
ncbi:MAG: 5-formyltetrahydrofolate cyclo-ligase [Zetaproteobacteria bacterium]|nr:MAG: 5-formyltetrahydrofolate cyclo-ligase [Zetaproteobacteria bacterium]